MKRPWYEDVIETELARLARAPADLCQVTGKRKLTAAAAHEQVRHSRRGFQARRCQSCGRWHVNTPVFINRQQQREKAARRQARTIPIDIEDDTP